MMHGQQNVKVCINVIEFIAADQIVNCTDSDLVIKPSNSNRHTTEK